MEDSSPAQSGAGSVPSRNSAGQRVNRGGRFSNRGGGGGRNNENRASSGAPFEGSMTSLKKHIFDVNSDGNQFMLTQTELSNHFGRTSKEYVGEITKAVDDLELTMPDPPDDPVAGASNVAFELWKTAVKEYNEKTKVLTDFKASLYSVALGQCTPALLSKVRSAVPDYEIASTARDGIAIMIIIRDAMTNIEDYRNKADSLCEALEVFFTFKQGRQESTQQYHDRFIAHNKVLDRVKGNAVLQGLVEVVAADIDNPTEGERAEALERLKAARFIRGTGDKYKSYLTDLKNSKLEGRDNYPTTVSTAYNILQRRTSDKTAPVIQEGVTFATVAGNNGALHERIQCFTCNQHGHFADQCPTTSSAGASGNGGAANGEGNISFALLQKVKRYVISIWWILIDSQSTLDLICNRELLNDIWTVEEGMHIRCNAGSRWTNQQGWLPGYGVVWYDPHAIANILSLSNVALRYRVKYDSEDGNRFEVTLKSGRKKVFEKSEFGLYYLDAAAERARSGSAATVLVNTVEDNKTRYTKAECDRAALARDLQIKIGRPSTRDFIKYVTKNLLPNCPVTKRDIEAAEAIFGPDVGSLKGKTVRRPPVKVDTTEAYTPLPRSVFERYQVVTLCADVMHVNGVAFFVSRSRNIRFGTVEAIPNLKKDTLLKSIKQVMAVYHAGGFRVKYALMDGAFNCLKIDLLEMKLILNDVAEEEHVGDIERYNRVLQERMRATMSMLPFKRVPPRLVIELANRENFWLNSFPHDEGISPTLSPRTIVTGQTLASNRHFKYAFGEYVQTHEHSDNTMAPRTIGALALRPTGNLQGNFYFLCLSTGRVLNRQAATPLPMPSDVIDQVHRMARQQKANRGLIFLDRDLEPLDDDDNEGGDDDDDEDDEDYIPDLENDEDDDYDANDGDDYGAAGADDDVAHPDDDNGDDESLDEDQGVNDNNDDANSSDESSSDNDSEESDNDELSSEDESEESDDDSNGDEAVLVETVNEADEEDPDDDLEVVMDAAYGERRSGHNLRPRRKVSYSHLHINFGNEESNKGVDCQDRQNQGDWKVVTRKRKPKVKAAQSKMQNKGVDCIGEQNKGVEQPIIDNVEEDKPLATPQMSMKRGIKLFGDDGVKAVTEELKQLHDREVMKVKQRKDLTPEQRRDALAYLMFLKRKRCGKYKARGCADGRKQKAWTSKEQATSPTVATEAVFLTAIIDALENRDVAIVDVPGAFMQADMDELVHIRFTGIMVDLLLKIDAEMYEPYVTYEGKEKVMYVELLKALYGTMRAARLFWEKLSAKLLEEGFVANPYDSCVVNKMINGKQCTIIWHVDDLKISHVEAKVVDQIIEMLDREFGKETPMNKSRGKVHDYLGMVLDFSKPGELTVDMVDYIKTVIAGMPKDMEGKAKTPAGTHLFKVNENPVLLDSEKAEVFHRIVMQLLYLCQRARPDVRTAIAFLSRRTSAPDIDDYRKLTRVMRYLQAHLGIKLTLSADGSGVVQWWVDAAYGVHHDMKSHTGGTLSMGKGSVYSYSSAQKLVSRSSTEAEVIGVDDLMPQMMWTGYFLKEQGIAVVDTVLYQDNMSSMLLEKNGRASSGKRTRHIDIRFYFVKDRVANGDLRIEHCPTEDMVADYFTKPLQGAAFYKLRDLIMNIASSSPYHSSQRSVLNPEDKVKDNMDDATVDDEEEQLSVSDGMRQSSLLCGEAQSGISGGSATAKGNRNGGHMDADTLTL
jgi:hypothetical protein